MAKSEESMFSKEQILTSKQFTLIEKDFLGVMLEDQKSYSITQVKELLEKEFKRVVK